MFISSMPSRYILIPTKKFSIIYFKIAYDKDFPKCNINKRAWQND